MGFNFDVNKMFENKPAMALVWAIVLILSILIGTMILDGKYNKVGSVEMNIPPTKVDTTKQGR